MTKDSTRYGLRGEEMLSKRRFALRAIKHLAHRYNYNLNILRGIFNADGHTVLLPFAELTDSQVRDERFFVRPDELLISADRQLWAVSSQWDKPSIDRFVKILGDMGVRVSVED